MATIDVSGLEAELRDKAEEIVDMAAELFIATAQEFAPRDSGDLAESIQRSGGSGAAFGGGGFSVGVECTSPYGPFQEEGTGIHGPTGQMIEPGHVMVFPGDGGMVFTMRSQGVQATHFWSDTVALEEEIWHNAQDAVG